MLSVFRSRRTFATVLGGTPFASKSPEQSQTLVEKIVQKFAVDLPEGKIVRSGDIISIRPSHVMTHDNTGAVLPKFRSIGAKKIKIPSQIVFTLDHDIQNKSEKNLAKYSTIETFAKEQNVDFYPAGRGIGHQVMVEEGYAFPYGLAVASDSHTNMYGAVGCLGTPVVRTDAAALWATGQTWWQIPDVIKVELKGQLSPGVTGKDVIISLASYFNHDEVLNAAVEFTGNGIRTLAVDERLAISNMTTEWGALVGLFPVDDILISWYEKLIKRMELARFSHANEGPSKSNGHLRLNEARLREIMANPMAPDPSAHYAKHLTIDLSTLVPHVSGPNSVKIATALPELEEKNIKINKAYLVSCTNSRVSDIKAAADVVRNHKIAPGVEFYVAAASSRVQADAEADGAWGDLIAAGAKTLPAGCGPCIGLGTGLLEEGEVGISATNRNYKGRMGSPKSTAYLASPAVVAASAIAGKIVGPHGLSGVLGTSTRPHTSMVINQHPSQTAASDKEVNASSSPSLLPLFPPRFEGPLVFVHQDNLNTDGIYPGKYTYNDSMTSADMAKVCMENYDKSFVEKATSPDTILVGGFNFGTGSSREQAATALKSRDIKLVIAGSFGDIFKRNAINNGLICVECPELVADLIKRYGREHLTMATNEWASYDCTTGRLEVQKQEGGQNSYQLRSVSPSVQEIYVADGLEGWVRQRL